MSVGTVGYPHTTSAEVKKEAKMEEKEKCRVQTKHLHGRVRENNHLHPLNVVLGFLLDEVNAF